MEFLRHKLTIALLLTALAFGFGLNLNTNAQAAGELKLVNKAPSSNSTARLIYNCGDMETVSLLTESFKGQVSEVNKELFCININNEICVEKCNKKHKKGCNAELSACLKMIAPTGLACAVGTAGVVYQIFKIKKAALLAGAAAWVICGASKGSACNDIHNACMLRNNCCSQCSGGVGGQAPMKSGTQN